MTGPVTVRSVGALRAQTGQWRETGATVALVPTMGALHDGHLSLVHKANELADRVVVSIFVNPRQFGPGEDYAAYPRDEAVDAENLAAVGADALYAPTVAEMYPDGFATTVHVGGLTDDLCGAARPGHFDGVATVVSKLLLQARPDVAVFGEKDYQQLLVIRRLVRDLDILVSIVGAPVVREPDGLALSSRNTYLTADQRRAAPALYKALCRASVRLEAGEGAAGVLAAARDEVVAAGFDAVDYLTLRDAATLAPLDAADRPARLLAAAHLGGARLIDNVPVAPAGEGAC